MTQSNYIYLIVFVQKYLTQINTAANGKVLKLLIGKFLFQIINLSFCVF